MVDYEILSLEKWILTSEGKEVAETGSHEARVFNAIPEGDAGIKIDEMVVRVLQSARNFF
jgi:phenylalanyl-tRNA synthetase alpha chain